MQPDSYPKILFGLTLLLVITAVISLGIGRYSLSVPQIGQILWAKATALEIDPVQQQVIFSSAFTSNFNRTLRGCRFGIEWCGIARHFFVTR